MQSLLWSKDEIRTEVLRLLDNALQRQILGIVGKPGAGKSTLTAMILSMFPKESVGFVGMDGFHLSNKVLDDLGIRNRKGAPDTFDVVGFASLLSRLRPEQTTDIYFPIFHREFEESYAAEGVVKAGVKLVVVEGNYLLHDDSRWGSIKSFLDETWYISIDDPSRQSRLVKRHEAHGKTNLEARDWVMETDEPNAVLVEASKKYATKIVALV